jgi:hypothetical protein
MGCSLDSAALVRDSRVRVDSQGRDDPLRVVLVEDEDL